MNNHKLVKYPLIWHFGGAIISWGVMFCYSVFLFYRYFGEVGKSIEYLFLLFLVPILFLSVSAAILRRTMKVSLGKYIIVTIFIGSVLGLILYFTKKTLFSMFSGSVELYIFSSIAALTYPLACPVIAANLSAGLFLIERKSKKYVIPRIVCILFFLILLWVGIIVLCFGVLSIPISITFAEFASTILFLIFIRKDIRKPVPARPFKKASKSHNMTAPESQGSSTLLSIPDSSQSGKRFCGTCGSEISVGNMFCTVCGSRLSDQLVGAGHMLPNSGAPGHGKPGYDADARSTGFAVLGFFFPVVGLILYIVWREVFPLRAKSAGKGAIIGTITYVALTILLAILQVALTMYLFQW